SSTGGTYLTIAAMSGNQGVAEWCLVKANININSKDVWGQVALHCAAWLGYYTVVKFLLSQDGIEVNPVSLHSRTPLDYAEMGEDQGMIKLLRAAGGRMAAELRMEYCTISFNSAWGVTCDGAAEILNSADFPVTCDRRKISTIWPA
ncbi:ankyrin repeat-containing domain protein, partial [Infundibulicybe gibba]